MKNWNPSDGIEDPNEMSEEDSSITETSF